MRIVSRRAMIRDYLKLAWRVAFVGFNNRGEVQYYLYGKKEGLKINPNMEYSMAGNPITQTGVY